MEKISDFFSELKERISNPFILSYFMGWCIWNYKIVVGLVFYKNAELKLDGYNSYLDLILCNSSTWHFFWLPLITAIGYTFIFPLFKNFILAFGIWNDTWGGNLNLKISKSQKVSLEKYLQYKLKYEEELLKVAKYVNEEEIFNQKLSASENQVQTLVGALEQSKRELDDLSKFSEVQLIKANELSEDWQKMNSNLAMDGEWYLKVDYKMGYKGNLRPTSFSYTVTIGGGKLIKTNENRDVEELYINDILCNFNRLIIMINTSHPSSQTTADITWEFFIQNKNFLVLNGKSNDGGFIQLRKKVHVNPPENDAKT